MKRWLQYWQGHNTEDLLWVLLALLFITSLALGLLHVALANNVQQSVL